MLRSHPRAGLFSSPRETRRKNGSRFTPIYGNSAPYMGRAHDLRALLRTRCALTRSAYARVRASIVQVGRRIARAVGGGIFLLVDDRRVIIGGSSAALASSLAALMKPLTEISFVVNEGDCYGIWVFFCMQDIPF